MSYELSLVGRSGRFKIYEVHSGKNEASKSVLDGTTGGTLDGSRLEARGEVVIEHHPSGRARQKRRGEIRF